MVSSPVNGASLPTGKGTAFPLVVDAVSRIFGAIRVLDGLSLRVERNEFVAIVGPSGCGKTTLLHLLSGHIAPSSGKIERSGVVRTIYQQDGLFPWLTVAGNIDMGLQNVRDARTREAQRAELIQLIRLQGFEQHYPHQLSGGMKQRVELARALAGDSDVLLMDEPFSALDYITRQRMRHELIRLLERRPRTVVFVTHDIEEAVQLADRVLVLSERPSRVRCELRLRASRPRDISDPEVLDAIHRISHELGLDELVPSPEAEKTPDPERVLTHA